MRQLGASRHPGFDAAIPLAPRQQHPGRGDQPRRFGLGGPMTTPEQKICENCAHWDSSCQSSLVEADITGQCRARAPGFDDRTGLAVWPFTETCDWCGDFKKAEAP